MNHIAAARAAALALGAIFVAGAGAATERSAFADRCTQAQVQVDEINRQVTVNFHNSCEEHVGCRVSWTLRCGKGAQESKQEDVRIDGRSDGAVVASALQCGDADWRINPPRWRCDEPDDKPVVERSSGTRKKKR